MYNVSAGGDKMLDLTALNSHVVERIDLDEEVTLSEDYYRDTEVLKLSPIQVKGSIYKDSNDQNVIDLVANGTMWIQDAISLEEVSYPFSFELTEESLETEESNQNSLDFPTLLWQNIVLEIPLKFTEVDDFSEFQGTGWKLLSEDELKNNQNPFNDLLSKFGEE